MGKIYAVSAAVSRFFSRPSRPLATLRHFVWAWAFNVLVGMVCLSVAIMVGHPWFGAGTAVLLLSSTFMFGNAARRYAAAKVEADFAREAELIFARLKLDFNRE